MLALSWMACQAASVAGLAGGPEAAAGELEWPPEFTWQAPGGGEVREVVDLTTGEPTLSFVESLEASGTTFYADFDAVDLSVYDLLTFSWRSLGDPVLARVTIEGYPEGGVRNYYLNKRPNPHGDWQRVWLELDLDDDGSVLPPPKELPADKLRLRFHLQQDPVKRASPEPRVAFRVKDLAFQSRPVEVTGNYGAVETIREDGRVGQRYPLELQKTGRPLDARLFGGTLALPWARCGRGAFALVGGHQGLCGPQPLP